MTLSAQDITVAYPGRPTPALRGVSIDLRPGTITAIIGPNGAGKSTLLRALLGVQSVKSGSVLLDSTPLHQTPVRDRAARIAFISQSPTIAFAYSLRQVVSMGRYARPPSDEAVERALARVRLQDRADDPFGELSAGLRQRGALARTLAQLDGAEPASRVLLADEPFSALDPRHALETEAMLRALAASGVAVGVVLHDLSLSARLADHALVLSDRGEPLAVGPIGTALAPDVLQTAFGVAFERLCAPSGRPILVAAGAGATPASPI
ncbi:MAG: ABC transporter ATP-binding protein [Phycisphaeraceae bacterium]|nr:ABC transporter ATP-binding protein [Phycisphaeraceae bacterium]